jgi:hypothetical protein
MSKKINEILGVIAKKKLGLNYLESRGCDRLDFKEQNVLSIKAALKEAYDTGYKMGKNEQKNNFEKS